VKNSGVGGERDVRMKNVVRREKVEAKRTAERIPGRAARVTRLLLDAYKRHGRDALTRLAVQQSLA
jgi:hypothetical protein